MIHVLKPDSMIPKRWAEAARKETDKNKLCFDNRGRMKKKPTFKVYGSASLRETLNKIFYYKCAYCEVHYGASQPVAIEHYRPKAPVTENKKEIPPGYYWLAAEWSNLLPACTDCNSARYHPFASGKEELRGKANQFPLANPKKRAKAPGEERHERPLLLNPTVHRPEEHLEFIAAVSKVGIVRPALNRRGRPSLLGERSVDVYALDRPELIEHRKNHAKRLLYHLRHLEEAALALEKKPNNSELKRRLQVEVADLEHCFLASRMEHLGMVRQFTFPRILKLARRKGLRRFAALLTPVLPSSS